MSTVGALLSHACRFESASETGWTGKRIGPQRVTLEGHLRGKSSSGAAG